jgi:hypothetical protein
MKMKLAKIAREQKQEDVLTILHTTRLYGKLLSVFKKIQEK